MIQPTRPRFHRALDLDLSGLRNSACHRSIQLHSVVFEQPLFPYMTSQNDKVSHLINHYGYFQHSCSSPTNYWTIRTTVTQFEELFVMVEYYFGRVYSDSRLLIFVLSGIYSPTKKSDKTKLNYWLSRPDSWISILKGDNDSLLTSQMWLDWIIFYFCCDAGLQFILNVVCATLLQPLFMWFDMGPMPSASTKEKEEALSPFSENKRLQRFETTS